MANSKRFVVKNGLETQNIQFVEQDGTESIILTVLEDGSISFSGSSGQLFSIVDSLTGSIFSVNDISGIPSIEVFDDGKVILAETTGNVGIGTLTPTEKLDVNGIVKGTRFTSTIATGTAPLTVTSTTAVTNLNADLLDGNHASVFYLASNPSGYTTNTGTVTSIATGSGLTGGTITTTGTLSVDSTVVRTTGDQTIAGNKTFSNNVTITGDLVINGTTTNINTTNLVIEDKNIVLGDVASPTNTTADGGGITLKGATDKTINWINSTGSWTFNQTVRHEGLNPSTGTNVDQLKSTTFASALTTAWTDVTGVSGTYLATGSYIVQIISNGEYYTGNLSWFSGTTTSTTADEIELHRGGPAASAARIYARVVRVSSGTLKLQVSASATLASHTMTFSFRRTI
jgi:hypothetical protein